MKYGHLAAIVAAVSASACALVCVALIHFFNVSRERLLRTLPKFVGPVRTSPKLTAIRKPSLPLSVSKRLIVIGNRLVDERYRRWLKLQLACTGSHTESALAALIFQKAMWAVCALLIAFTMFYRGIVDGLVAVILAPIIGFMVPDFLMARAIRKRSVRIDKQLPDAIALMRLCMTAGLNFESAMARISIAMDGPLAEEFAGLNLAIRAGSSRVEALSRLAARTKSGHFKQFIAALIQAESLGVSVGTRLSELARTTRESQRSKIRESGQKLGVKLTLPLLFCFLPAMFVIVLGPALVNLAGLLAAL